MLAAVDLERLQATQSKGIVWLDASARDLFFELEQEELANQVHIGAPHVRVTAQGACAGEHGPVIWSNHQGKTTFSQLRILNNLSIMKLDVGTARVERERLRDCVEGLRAIRVMWDGGTVPGRDIEP